MPAPKIEAELMRLNRRLVTAIGRQAKATRRLKEAATTVRELRRALRLYLQAADLEHSQAAEQDAADLQTAFGEITAKED